ncbi:G2/M phase-specific E3 ubiquitin-protein ligase [Merluccius polli]|uniref:G2/M phase-specific E3 ubiquitin-protein ligase n=1 Tax=Merluccius polli TaxID=89951 RepID=A0AA47NUF6_MERPO|nr:G2/M phase-specific E3 ubiquitin-protein ligase [Merluccius polli]
MIAVCVVHGGVGPHFFSESLFQQICGIPTPPAMVDEVGDHTIREQLIKEATMVQEANSAIAEAADSLSIIGALRRVQLGGEGLPCPVCCRLLCQRKDADCHGPVSNSPTCLWSDK